MFAVKISDALSKYSFYSTNHYLQHNNEQLEFDHLNTRVNVKAGP